MIPILKQRHKVLTVRYFIYPKIKDETKKMSQIGIEISQNET